MSAVTCRMDGEVAILTIDNPPVNALSQAVRAGLRQELQRVAVDATVKAVVLIGAGRTFVAGADIREFGKPPQPPGFHEVLGMLETFAKPVVAALHGTALGGGLELALGCNYRIALASARLGLPEINLGLLPGGGGTQKLPRLVGPQKALDMMLSGKPIAAPEALSSGLVDAVIDAGANLAKEAVEFARVKAAAGGPHPRTHERQDKFAAGAATSLFDEVRAKNGKKWVGQIAPQKIVDCVQTACRVPFAEGMRFEREAFQVLHDSAQSRAMRHAFFAEREAAKIPGLPPDITGKPVRSAAVIGAGTMGGGIAMCFANAGIPVKVLEADAAALERGLQRVRSNYATSVTRGSMTAQRADQALALITTTTRYEDLADADIVIEAVFEEMAVKQEVFRALDQAMKPGAVLATNTSTLDIDQIAAATRRPQDVVGTHFFSPANVMKLQENVRGAQSSPQTIATVMSLAKALGKVAVLAGNCDGFIGNRILHVYGRECDFLLEEGATPWQVDRALQGFGFPMGLYLMRDMAGLDVGWRIRKRQEATRDRSLRHSPVPDRICELGRYGQKTGAGYYKYSGRDATPDPEIERLIEAAAREQNISRRTVSDEEIVSRVLCSMVNEGAKIVAEGIAIRASDIDVVYLYGYGFPRHQGGPMYWAEATGLAEVYRRVQDYHREHGVLWTPAPLLEQLAKKGARRWDEQR